MAAMQLPSFRRQQLLVEYAGLKHAKLRGIYVSLTPNDPSQWVGVLFVSKGPYKGAIFRFRIHFPTTYPFKAPTITFTSDVFHPLLTPLTTYTYTESPQSTPTSIPTRRGASSASANASPTTEPAREYLPPGSLSLRPGFPCWFARGEQALADGEQSEKGPDPHSSRTDSPPREHLPPISPADVKITDLLIYIRTAFESVSLLEFLRQEDAVNPGAWFAWQSFRGRDTKRHTPDEATVQASSGATASPRPRPKGLGDWEWDGVWEDRVRRAVQASASEGALYGNASGLRDEDVRFFKMGEEELEDVRRGLRERIGDAG